MLRKTSTLPSLSFNRVIFLSEVGVSLRALARLLLHVLKLPDRILQRCLSLCEARSTRVPQGHLVFHLVIKIENGALVQERLKSHVLGVVIGDDFLLKSSPLLL